MSEPFLGQISVFAFPFAPRGWALCNGQLLPIAQNQALFALLGTTYGGNGTTTFALPDLRGRTAMHANSTHPQGQSAGEEAHKLLVPEMPSHRHGASCNSTSSGQVSPVGKVWGTDTAGNAPYAASADSTCSSAAIAPAGSGQPHDNMAPSLTVNFCIALQGIFPSRS
jgi:microcystin-dependent protein